MRLGGSRDGPHLVKSTRDSKNEGNTKILFSGETVSVRLHVCKATCLTCVDTYSPYLTYDEQVCCAVVTS